MQRPERSLPPPISTAQAELAVVKQRLMEMDKALRAERLARSQFAAKAKAEISSLRREMENSAPAGPDSATPAAVRFGGSLAFSVIAIAVAAAVAGFSVWYVDPLHTWDGHPPVVSHSPEAAKAEPSPAPPLGASSETHEFSRLNDAVRSVPAPSASVLDAANQWLGTTGQQACSVQSPQGDVSLVISGHGGDKPLLSALSRCATAVEHLTKPGTHNAPDGAPRTETSPTSPRR